ncbi:MAG: ferric reductase-like transmembrane domain-containing protein [Acidimicrobiia bacterium]|nr:ferric reductase-like transmembrane domain-containing protein [Acidimicrobiia bacterium]
MNGHLTWYVARAAGIVTWALLVASMIWGLLYATRVFRRRVSLWWLLGVHRFLGALAVVFTAVHVVALLSDSFIGFGVRDVLVPFTSSWHPIAVGWGIIAMYLLVAIELTSLLKARLPYRVWRSVHLTSYPVFAIATIHGLSSGTDVKVVVTSGLGVAFGAIAIAISVIALDQRMTEAPRRPVPGPRSPAEFG